MTTWHTIRLCMAVLTQSRLHILTLQWQSSSSCLTCRGQKIHCTLVRSARYRMKPDVCFHVCSSYENLLQYISAAQFIGHPPLAAIESAAKKQLFVWCNAATMVSGGPCQANIAWGQFIRLSPLSSVGNYSYIIVMCILLGCFSIP